MSHIDSPEHQEPDFAVAVASMRVSNPEFVVLLDTTRSDILDAPTAEKITQYMLTAFFMGYADAARNEAGREPTIRAEIDKIEAVRKLFDSAGNYLFTHDQKLLQHKGKRR